MIFVDWNLLPICEARRIPKLFIFLSIRLTIFEYVDRLLFNYIPTIQ
ncbi:conserved hypothetical protein [Burkholderia pseudomallei 576]|nr:conserved hypothetical protein [Burkholderia pseudomallei 576]